MGSWSWIIGGVVLGVAVVALGKYLRRIRRKHYPRPEIEPFDRGELLHRDALARQRGENLDGSPRRETRMQPPVTKSRPGYHPDRPVTSSYGGRYEGDRERRRREEEEERRRREDVLLPGQTYEDTFGGHRHAPTPDPEPVRGGGGDSGGAGATGSWGGDDGGSGGGGGYSGSDGGSSGSSGGGSD